jgi:hypothetical protein
VASSSHETAAFCLGVAATLRHAESHAYLLKTGMADVYEREFAAGRVAWIGSYVEQVPQLWLVSDKVPQFEDALGFAKEVMAMLGMSRTAAYVRTDPHFWPAGSCSPYSLPLQGRRPVPADERERGPDGASAGRRLGRGRLRFHTEMTVLCRSGANWCTESNRDRGKFCCFTNGRDRCVRGRLEAIPAVAASANGAGDIGGAVRDADSAGAEVPILF